jgi:hypothetical protein
MSMRVIQIDPMPACNLRCPLCESGNGTSKRHAKLMDMSRFEDILAQAEGFTEVHLFNRGESLLHPNIGEMIAACRARGLRVGLHSNLNVPQLRLRVAIEAGLDTLVASIDGVTQPAYASYRRKGDVELALGNLAIAAKLQDTHPLQVTWQFLVNRYNEHELEGARALASALGVGFCPRPIGVGEDVPDLQPAPDLPVLIEEWVARANPYAVRASYGGRCFDRPLGVACGYLDTVTVHPDLAVGPCCMTVDPASDFGSLTQHRLAEVLDNQQFRAARALFGLGPAQPDANVDVVCARCPAYHDFLQSPASEPEPPVVDLQQLVDDPELAAHLDELEDPGLRRRAAVALETLELARSRFRGTVAIGPALLVVAHDLLFHLPERSMCVLPAHALVILGSHALGSARPDSDLEFMVSTLERTPEFDDVYLPSMLGMLLALGARVDPWCASNILLGAATSSAELHELDDQLDHPALRRFAAARDPGALTLIDEPLFCELMGRQVSGSLAVGRRVRRRKLAVMRQHPERVLAAARAMARFNLDATRREHILTSLVALAIATKLDDPATENLLIAAVGAPTLLHEHVCPDRELDVAQLRARLRAELEATLTEN